MHRIANGTQTNTLPAVPDPVGTPGYATAGDPVSGVPATILSAEDYNAIQEEICTVIESQGLTLDRANNAQLLAAIQNMRGFSRMQVFTSSTIWTVPNGVTLARVTVVAGGSGASGCSSTVFAGACGGGGGWAIGIVSLAPGQQIAITVGQGGTGSAAQTPSGAGGTSSFGALLSATGGQPSANSAGNNNGAYGGIGTGGTLNGSGDDGADGAPASASGNWAGKSGGSLFGGSVRCGASGGRVGANWGAGGSSPCYVGTTVNGANGAAGIVIVEY